MYVDLLCVSLSSETERNKHYVIEVRELKEQIIVYEKQITKLEKEITVVEDRYQRHSLLLLSVSTSRPLLDGLTCSHNSFTIATNRLR